MCMSYVCGHPYRSNHGSKFNLIVTRNVFNGGDEGRGWLSTINLNRRTSLHKDNQFTELGPFGIPGRFNLISQ